MLFSKAVFQFRFPPFQLLIRRQRAELWARPTDKVTPATLGKNSEFIKCRPKKNFTAGSQSRARVSTGGVTEVRSDRSFFSPPVPPPSAPPSTCPTPAPGPSWINGDITATKGDERPPIILFCSQLYR